MDNFSTQYTPSNAGLVRAVPLMQKALKTGGGAFALVFFATGFVSFFLMGLADALLPRLWPGYPSGLPFATACVFFGVVTLALVLPWMRRRTARRFDQLLPPTLTRLAADESGVTISDELSHGHWDWRHVRGAIATPDGIAILMGYSGIHVPASAFRDPSEQAAVVDLINRRADRSAV